MNRPDLEAKCTGYKGSGSVYEGNEDCSVDCAKCNGSGFVPTADGKRVWASLPRLKSTPPQARVAPIWEA